MRIFEPHIHMYARVTDDYERMALAGVEATIEPAFWLGQPRTHAGSFFDYFSHLLEYEATRAAGYGIRLFAAIAVNPREANQVPMAEEVLAQIDRFLDHPRCVAVGEVGFDRITAEEERFLRRQVEKALQKRLPILVHAPHQNKRAGIERTIRILQEMKVPGDQAVIDHSTEETTGLIREAGYWAGHSVYPVTKLSPERAVNILQRHGVDRMMIHSAADWGPSDPLSVPRTVLEMRRRGFTSAQIEQGVWTNPHTFFGLSGRVPSW